MVVVAGAAGRRALVVRQAPAVAGAGADNEWVSSAVSVKLEIKV